MIKMTLEIPYIYVCVCCLISVLFISIILYYIIKHYDILGILYINKLVYIN